MTGHMYTIEDDYDYYGPRNRVDWPAFTERYEADRFCAYMNRSTYGNRKLFQVVEWDVSADSPERAALKALTGRQPYDNLSDEECAVMVEALREHLGEAL